MKGEFFYSSTRFSEVFYRLNPNLVSQTILFQYVVRSSVHGWHPPFGVEIQLNGNCGIINTFAFRVQILRSWYSLRYVIDSWAVPLAEI